jgi:hypothetical protein
MSIWLCRVSHFPSRRLRPQAVQEEATAIAWFNHVSVFAKDICESAELYVGLFGAKPISTRNFGFHGQWLQLGDLHPHFYSGERREAAPQNDGHFALGIEDSKRSTERRSLGASKSPACGTSP